MNKKAFTLVEVLGIIVILGVITLIIVPSVKNIIKDSKQKLYDEQIIQIEDGLKNWASANIFLLPEHNNSIKLSLGQLKQAGFAERIIKNPKNKKCFSNESTLTITKYNNNYIYDAKDIVDVDCELLEDNPIIKLNGSEVEYLKVGDAYTDPGATAKDESGLDLTNSIVTTMSDNFDIAKAGNYTITYNITSNGKKASVIRNVVVQEKKLSELTTTTNKCATDKTKDACKPGTLFTIKVNDTTTKYFYVLNDDGTTISLIMSENLGNPIPWYDISNSSGSGPITALNYLDELTDDEWNNIPKQEHTYSGIAEDGVTRRYPDFTRTMRVRMITYNEAFEIKKANNDLMPNYMYGGNHYWTSTASSETTWWAYLLNNDGTLNTRNVTYGKNVSDNLYNNGVRPVIELTK